MRERRAPAVLLALGGGLLAATQARVNGQFGLAVGDPVAAAMLSAAVGFALLSPVALGAPSVRAGIAALAAAARSATMPGWALLAGALGGFVLFSQAFAVPALGVALYSVIFVASVTTSGLLVDRAGLGPAGSHGITANRLGGAALSVVAVLVVAGPDLSVGQLALAAVLVAAAAGMGGAAQSAMLGHLGTVSGRPLAATWVNFLGATVVLAVGTAIRTAAGGSWGLPPLGWMWLGGPLGLTIVGIIVLAVPHAGVLLVSMAVTAGQLVGSLAWDLVAPVSGRAVDVWSVAGAVLLLAAVGLAARPERGS